MTVLMHYPACRVLKAETLKADLLEAYIAPGVLTDDYTGSDLHPNQFLFSQKCPLVSEATQHFQFFDCMVQLD